MAAAQAKMKKIGTDFTTGDVLPQLMKFMLPFLLANIVNSIYNTVDTIVIGQYVGSVGIVAVSMGGKMLNLFTNVSIGLATGAQVLIGQELGAKQNEELNGTIGTQFSLMALISVAIGVLCLVFTVPILNALNTPAESMQGAQMYMWITSVGMPLIFGYNTISAVLRSMGNSKQPLLFIVIAGIINLVLDIVFVVNFRMGPAGTAYATVIGQGVAFIVSIIYLYRRKEAFCFDFKKESFKIDWTKAKVMLHIGIPVAAQGAMINVTQIFMMRYINLCGVTESAAYAIGDKIVTLTNIFSVSIKQAGGSMVAQNIGARKFKRVDEIVWKSMWVTMGVAVVLAGISILFPVQMFEIFTQDADVIAFAVPFMRISAIIYLVSSAYASFAAVTTGSGNALWSFVAGFMDGVVLRVCCGFLFAYTFHMGIIGFYLGNAVARFGPLLIHGLYYFMGSWRKTTYLEKMAG